jgi:hypothetical protein
VKLQDRLPDSVRINGKRYAADFDFRNVLRMMDILGDKNLTDEAREWLAVKCIMKKPVKGALDAIRKILFGADKEEEQVEDDGTRLTSFDQDAALIRAAFWQTYRINLYTEKLHWLAFLELLRGLPEGTRYMEVVGIRAKPMPAPTKYNTEERQWLQKAKARYAVKQTEEETARNYDRGVQKVFAGLMGMIKG